MVRLLSNSLRLVLLLVLAVAAVTTTGLAIGPALADLGDVSEGAVQEITLDDLSERSYVYSADGQLIATFQEEENRAPIEIEDVPTHVIDAVLSVEDADFFSHAGVNVRATVRALLSNVETGAISQGGSTITQQLVKQSLLTSDQDFDRKTREAFLAVRLEKQMSKLEILERYLNTIYLGNHAYGIQAGAETYFGVGVDELDIGQAALLAGLIRDPIDYNPFRYPDIAIERRRIALRRMVEEGTITEDDAAFHNAAPMPSEPIQFTPPPDDYFVEEVKQALLDDPRLGETATERYDAVFRGGLRIHTTIDLRLQFLAEVARNEVLSRFALENQPALFIAGRNQAGEDAIGTIAMATVEPSTGAVRAMVGGPGFSDESKFNLATQGYRQPGSSFKTFVLLELLEQGYAPQDTVSGRGPCTFDIPGVDEPYKVENFGNSGGFVGSIRSMTTASSNCGYVRLGQIAGIDNVTSLAGELGVRTRNAANEIVDLSPDIFSTPLGTQEVTPLGMAAAYAAMPNDGYYNPPYVVEYVLDRRNDLVFEHGDVGYQAVTEDSARIAADILKANVLGGTGGRARVSGHDVGGKTGTAQDFSNAWFVGFSKQYSTAVWMGAIEGNVPMRRVGGRSVTGGSYPAEIFGQFMNAVLENLEPEDFADAPRRSGQGSLRVDPEIDRGGSTATRPARPARPSRPTATTAPADGGGGGDDGDGGDGGEGDGGDDGDGGGGGPTSAPATTAPAPTTAPPTTGDFIEP